MGGYTWTEIIAAFSLCVGIIGASVPFLTWLSGQIEKRKKERVEKNDKKLHDSIEIRRLENETEDAEWKRITEMLKTSQAEEERLRVELAQLRNIPSLSGLTITQLYSAVGKLGQNIDHLEWMIVRDGKYEGLTTPMAILKQSFEQLREKLP